MSNRKYYWTKVRFVGREGGIGNDEDICIGIAYPTKDFQIGMGVSGVLRKMEEYELKSDLTIEVGNCNNFDTPIVSQNLKQDLYSPFDDVFLNAIIEAHNRMGTDIEYI